MPLGTKNTSRKSNKSDTEASTPHSGVCTQTRQLACQSSQRFDASVVWNKNTQIYNGGSLPSTQQNLQLTGGRRKHEDMCGQNRLQQLPQLKTLTMCAHTIKEQQGFIQILQGGLSGFNIGDTQHQAT